MRAYEWRRELEDLGALSNSIESEIARTRSKQRSHPQVKHFMCKTFTGASPAWSGSFDWPLGSEEHIIYECTRGQRTAYCDHQVVKLSASPTLGDVDMTSPLTGVRYVTEGSPYGFSDNNIAWHFPSEPSTLPWDVTRLEDYLKKGISTIRPNIPQYLSLPVTLGEIGDLRRLFADPIKLARSFSKLRSGSSLPKKFWKSTAKLFLWEKFGVEQTVRDALGLYQVFSNLGSTATRLAQQQGHLQKSYARVYHEATKSEETEQSHGNDWKWTNVQSVVAKEEVNVTLRYVFTLYDSAGQPLRDSGLIKLGVALDSMGFGQNPTAIVWDLIPFSFVVDYFVKVGDFLDSFSSKNVQARVDIADACVSHKFEATCSRDFTQSILLTGNSSRVMGRSFLVKESKRYHRERFLPRPEWLHPDHELSFAAPSWEQWGTLGALLTANLR